MLGIELHERAALAVAIGDDGQLRARAEVDGSSDLAAAALTALDRVAPSDDRGTGLGVSSIAPESPATMAVLAALGPRYSGSFVHDGATASGTAAALAEAWIGAASAAPDVVFFAVAEHTTAGIVRGGAPVVGAHRRAPAVAWLALNPVEREDYRRTGCLEAEVGTAGIVRRLIWRIKAGDRSHVEETVKGDLSKITIEHVLEAARQDDGVAVSVVRDTAKYLGMAAANLVALADPDMLVLGGLMASAADLFLELLRTEITRRLPGAMMQALTIAPAALGADAAAIGAARLGAAVLR
ncbi:MAG TPA: ROK family protein [Vicinamibacterales bacterium]|nr:ROK family protein [Vicinamibacterales bacterium]